LISQTLDIDQSFAHTIEWRGATIISSTALNPMILVDKRASNGGLTTMRHLALDGSQTATRTTRPWLTVDGRCLEASPQFAAVEARQGQPGMGRRDGSPALDAGCRNRMLARVVRVGRPARSASVPAVLRVPRHEPPSQTVLADYRAATRDQPRRLPEEP
jgi:hypothetical protein